ncbi:MAG: SDR family NAD(P)-dependent oxidoreductase [Acidimicrobiia bacterium]
MQPVMSDSEFGARVALVTGAAGQGIGRAIATRLSAGGAQTVVADVHPGRVECVTEELAAAAPAGVRVVGKVLDVRANDAMDVITAEVADELGPIQILVNNAAHNVMGPIWDYRPDDWARVMDTNLNGPWYLTKLAMTQMRDAGGGVVVNISSVAPDSGGRGLEGPYAVSKAGLSALTRSCAHEGGPYGIRCNIVTMGLVRGTRFAEVVRPDMVQGQAERAPLRELPHAEDIAEAVAFLASDRARYITGETINVDAGGYMRY